MSDDDSLDYDVEVTMMLDKHVKEPHAARWFGLGCLLASRGWGVHGYEPNHFYADRENDDGQVVEEFTCDVQEDGSALWVYSSPYGVEAGEEEDLDNLQEEGGSSESWQQVHGDLITLWNGG
jgi:hypothetical protein